MRPWTTAPVRSASSAVAGEWSVCVWVAKIQRTVRHGASTLSTYSGSERSRIDDRPLVARTAADEVGVGPRAGHHAAVVRADAGSRAGTARPARPAGSRSCRCRAPEGRCGRVRPTPPRRGDRAHALAADADPRHHEGDLARRTHHAINAATLSKRASTVERLHGRRHQFEPPPRASVGRRSHSCSTISLSSWLAVCPRGAAATKKRRRRLWAGRSASARRLR